MPSKINLLKNILTKFSIVFLVYFIFISSNISAFSQSKTNQISDTAKYPFISEVSFVRSGDSDFDSLFGKCIDFPVPKNDLPTCMDYKWLEIYNPTSLAIDLDDLRVSFDGFSKCKNGCRIRTSGAKSVPANSFVVAGYDSGSLSGATAFSGNISHIDNGKTIGINLLYGKNKKMVDRFEYDIKSAKTNTTAQKCWNNTVASQIQNRMYGKIGDTNLFGTPGSGEVCPPKTEQVLDQVQPLATTFGDEGSSQKTTKTQNKKKVKTKKINLSQSVSEKSLEKNIVKERGGVTLLEDSKVSEKISVEENISKINLEANQAVDFSVKVVNPAIENSVKQSKLVNIISIDSLNAVENIAQNQNQTLVQQDLKPVIENNKAEKPKSIEQVKTSTKTNSIAQSTQTFDQVINQALQGENMANQNTAVQYIVQNSDIQTLNDLNINTVQQSPAQQNLIQESDTLQEPKVELVPQTSNSKEVGILNSDNYLQESTVVEKVGLVDNFDSIEVSTSVQFDNNLGIQEKDNLVGFDSNKSYKAVPQVDNIEAEIEVVNNQLFQFRLVFFELSVALFGVLKELLNLTKSKLSKLKYNIYES